jgi:2-polyprenyl-3-methyl-5-hydroxy-6-metoxy-1,4-benzoquinol methylase
MNTYAKTPAAIPRDYDSATSHRYHLELLPHLMNSLAELPAGARVLDAGCGNGFISGEFLKRGFRVLGIDVSESGINICRREYSTGQFEVASICDPDIKRIIGDEFDAIVASEVVEHLYSPAEFLDNCHSLLKKNGILALSTPYHGYLKNLLLALAGKLDAHLQADHEGGHIKFWSRRSLTKELEAHGFRIVRIVGCGRIPFLWKSMAVKAVKEV